ncbi:MAG: RHS repeat-associated core domain-containing protein, partial [Candidatus Poribacteria bacterium]
EYTYDENSNLKQIKDANANMTAYAYDDFDRLASIVYADNSKEEYTYDANSNLVSKKSPKGQTVYYEYDALNRLNEKGLSPKGAVPSSVITYTCDNGSRLIDVKDSIGTLHYDYDPINRITQVAYPDAKSVSYAYDNNSNRVKLTYPDATYITYEYDQLNRLTAIKGQDAQAISQYTYDALSRRTQLDYANNTQTTYAYDDINRLVNLTNKVKTGADISAWAYTYDKASNRKTMLAKDGTHNYTYDNNYQLKVADYPAGFSFPDIAFNYDSVGNRASTIDTATTNYTANNLNQYSKVGTAVYTYDANGSLTQDSTFTYGYDYENRLTSAVKTGATTAYKYDAFGRRIEKNVNGAITKFLYDGDQLIAEYDSSGSLTAKYIYGPGIDEPILLDKAGTKYYYHFDGLGSVTNLTNSTGSTSETYAYDAFGKPSATSTLGNRFMFTGREYDSETGLYYYRARHYAPEMGRFLQRDPLGFIGGINLYTYSDNNSINLTDPYGLWVALGERSVLGAGSHTVIILHPDKGSDFKKDKRIKWYRNANGELEATLSANPDRKSNSWGPLGNLTAYTNDISDRPGRLKNIQRVLDPLNRSDSQLIKDIITSASKYAIFQRV